MMFSMWLIGGVQIQVSHIIIVNDVDVEMRCYACVKVNCGDSDNGQCR